MWESANPEAARELSGRERSVLASVIEAYLASGLPVGSRMLAEMRPDSPSSATIRHVLADLEQSGYLTHPHTSAGRVPTHKSIRWWLQQMQPPQAQAADEQAQQLERTLRLASDETTIWLRASEFLSEMSRQIGVVAVQPWKDTGLKQVRFFRLTEQRVLAILVATDGQVRERVARVPEAYTQPELDAAGRYFNQNFAGATLSRIRRELVHRIEEERAAYDELLKRVVVLSHCGVLEMQDDGQVFFQGADHLADLLNGEQLGQMLARLNQKQQWLHLLTGISETGENVVAWSERQELGEDARSMRVHVGLAEEQMPEFSLIATRCRHGALGVLGPMRMEYQRALGAVALVRDLFERVLGEDRA